MGRKPLNFNVREYFDYVDGKLFWKISLHPRIKVGDLAGCANRHGHWHIGFKGKYYLRGRLVWIWHHGEISLDKDIDHVNRIRHDDRIENLRLVSHRKNQQNRTDQSLFGSGIYKRPNGKYQAQIKVGRKRKTLGTFQSLEEAKQAYYKAAEF